MNPGQGKEFRERLLAWFHQFQRRLPWRKDRDPYRIWISEIMLQQTRVAAAIPYYERFLERFPDVKALAAAPEEEVMRFWSGLGYYSRVRNLQKAAQQIVALHGGRFPRTWEEVKALPGIGDYTAAAVMSMAFGEKLAVLDGNVARVLARLGAVRGDLREAKQWRQMQRTADRLLDPAEPGDWNQAMMELGATLCAPRAPQCLLCPVADFCKARKQGVADEIPEKRRKPGVVEVNLVAVIFLNPRGETLLLPPPAEKERSAADDVPSLVSRMWHFPARSAARKPAPALKRLLRSFKISRKSFAEELQRIHHTVTYRKVSIFPFRITVRKLPQGKGGKKVPLKEVSSQPVSSLTRKIANAALEMDSSNHSHH